MCRRAPSHCPAPRRRHRRRGGSLRALRRGLTIIELTMSVAVLAMVATAVASLAHGVRVGSEYSRQSAELTQHAQVALARITNRIERAWATEGHPGVVVVHESSGGAMVPTALVVWQPESGTPLYTAGPPLVRELVIFTANPKDPRQLLEVRARGDNRAVPLEEFDTAEGRSLVASLVDSPQAERIVLTELLRTTSGSGIGGTRAATWFVRRLRPTGTELAMAHTGALAWENLPWPQGIYSTRNGLRQVWVRIELQLVPPGTTSSQMADRAVPFFGSAAIYHEVKR